jgi:hypothetical protein
VTIANRWISTSVWQLPEAVVGCCDQAVPSDLSGLVTAVQVLDFPTFFGRAPSGHAPSGKCPQALKSRSENCRMTSSGHSKGDIWAASAGRPDGAGSLPAQPLQSLAAVARFDSSSPHGIAVRGNQEKMR